MPRDCRTTMNVARVVHRLLTDPRGWRVDELCSELGWCSRTFRKHKKRLIEDFEPFAGPNALLRPQIVRQDGHKYFRLVEDTQFSQTDPDFAHKLGTLAWMRQLLSVLDGTAMGDSAEGWVVQVRDAVHDSAFVFRDWLGDLDRMLVYVPRAPKSYAEKAAQLDVILSAVMHHRNIQIWYSGSEEPFEMQPWSLLLHDSAVYVYGARDDQQERLLSVDRIDRVEQTGSRFRYPSDENYDPSSLFCGGFGIFRDGRDPVSVELLVENLPWLKKDIIERQWHPSQRIEELEDGRLRLSFETAGAVDVAHWLFGRAPYIECISPTLSEWTSLLQDAAGPAREAIISHPPEQPTV
ncbi:MAG: hypothetical protein ACI81R_001599 [Bradymonadia bacterium]|jgi:hypothetical protein